jgi:hypothetical protein
LFIKRAFAVFCAFAPLVAVSACTLLVSTGGLAGNAAPLDASDAASSETLDGESATGPSCRAIHARFPNAGTGSYMLTAEGGASVKAHCDMESFGGGWTLVTAAMIVEEKAVQDYAPGGPARVDVVHSTDTNGGITLSMTVAAQNCGAASGKPGPGHYFKVGDLDGWTQIMATYEFGSFASCWNIFGDPGLRDTNVQAFNPALDSIGPQVNMARTAAGAVIPYEGRTTMCTEKPENFWANPYKTQRKSARVVLRRFTQGKPAGLALALDCGSGGWTITDIRVR